MRKFKYFNIESSPDCQEILIIEDARGYKGPRENSSEIDYRFNFTERFVTRLNSATKLIGNSPEKTDDT